MNCLIPSTINFSTTSTTPAVVTPFVWLVLRQNKQMTLIWLNPNHFHGAKTDLGSSSLPLFVQFISESVMFQFMFDSRYSENESHLSTCQSPDFDLKHSNDLKHEKHQTLVSVFSFVVLCVCSTKLFAMLIPSRCPLGSASSYIMSNELARYRAEYHRLIRFIRTVMNYANSVLHPFQIHRCLALVNSFPEADLSSGVHIQENI